VNNGFIQDLCYTASVIQDGLHAVACSCKPLIFDGSWSPDLENVPIGNEGTEGSCFNTPCSEQTSGVLYGQSLVCYETRTTLSTYNINGAFYVEESCVNVMVTVAHGRVYTQSPQSPLALSFLQTNYNFMDGNTYAVVTSDKGVTVGQIVSDMIRVEIRPPPLIEEKAGGDLPAVLMAACVLLDPTMGERGTVYVVFDLGILNDHDGSIRPLGMEAVGNVTTRFGTVMVCFGNVTLVREGNTSLILIERVADYESRNAYSSGEESVVYTSGALFCFGAMVVVFVHVSLEYKKLAVLTVGLQSVCLLLFRGVYFFVLGAGEVAVGGLLDFALIEIPTFMYIGIFFEIIIVSYWLFMRPGDLASPLLPVEVVAALVMNWLVFGVLMTILALSDPTSTSVAKSCDCQLFTQTNHSGQIIRIVYKSFVVAIAACVTFVTVVFGRVPAWKGGVTTEYNIVLGLSLGLLCDCIAFLIYYSVNTPTAYFLIVLWFTELLPICVMNGMWWYEQR
jgi:hypothetical protein